jgi:hypothetical protein
MMYVLVPYLYIIHPPSLYSPLPEIIPTIYTGLTVRHGSTQSVAEFYGQYYSNSDLATFLALTGKYGTTVRSHIVVNIQYVSTVLKLC